MTRHHADLPPNRPGRARLVLAARRMLGAALLLSAGLLGLAASETGAEEWSFVGARYQGMGGAGVALVDDEHASYWNPGALAFTQSYGVALPVGGQAATEGAILSKVDRVAEFIDDLSAGEFDTLISDLEAGNALDADQVGTAFSLAAVELPGLDQSGEGLAVSFHAALLLRYQRFALTGLGVAQFAADPYFDRDNLSVSDLTGDAAVDQLVAPGTAMDRYAGNEPALVARLEALFLAAGSGAPNLQAEELVFQIEQAGVDVDDAGIAQNIFEIAQATIDTADASFAQNQSGAFVRGLSVEEVGFAYGHPLWKNRIGIGGNLKYMVGTTFNKFVRYDDIDSGSDLVSEISDSKRRETTHTASLDLGLMVKPFEWLRFGLTARNVTSPEFDLARDPSNPSGKSSLTLEPQVRAGAALWVLPNWAVALDVDLTKNESDLLDGYASQLVSLGTEFKIPVWKLGLALRAGAYLNTASDDPEAVALTAGLGIRFFDFNFDLAAGASPKTQKLEAANGTEVPSRANLSAMLSFRKTF